jgi:hypothetical protein
VIETIPGDLISNDTRVSESIPVESDRIHWRRKEIRDQRPTVLDPSLHEFSDLFHPPAVDAEVAIADSGRGPEMDRSGLGVEEKLHIVDKSKQPAGEFKMQVGLFFADESGAGQRQHRGLERFFCSRLMFLIPQRRDRMLLVLSLRRDAIGARGTRQLFHNPGPFMGRPRSQTIVPNSAPTP